MLPLPLSRVLCLFLVICSACCASNMDTEASEDIHQDTAEASEEGENIQSGTRLSRCRAEVDYGYHMRAKDRAEFAEMDEEATGVLDADASLSASGGQGPKPVQFRSSLRSEQACGWAAIRSANGSRQSNHRIAGGYAAKPGQFPSYVYLKVHKKSNKNAYCGGTILDSQHVLTAAHCFRDFTSKSKARIKSLIHWKEVRSAEGWVTAKKICISPKFDKKNKRFNRHDLAVLKLEKELEFSDTIQPACLPISKIDDSVQAYAVGMGHVADDLPEHDPKLHPKVLQVLPVKRTECSLDQHYSVVCFRSNTDQNRGDTCSGDSGGPVLAHRDGGWTVYAVTSYGPDACSNGKIGIGHYADPFELRSELDSLLEDCA